MKDKIECYIKQIGNVCYGRIPSGLIEGWNGIVFFFHTADVYDAKKHEDLIKPIIEQIEYQNDESEHGVSWRIMQKDAVVWEPRRQITLVSWRVRDSY